MGGLSQAGSVCLAYSVGEAVVDGGSAGQTVVTAGFEQPSSYDYWSTAGGLLFGPSGDSDGDGADNRHEYASGTDPLHPGSKAHPQVSFGPGGKLSITMTKGTAAGDLIWSAEVSSDLAVWTTKGMSIVVNDATTFSAEFTGVSPRVFLRLCLFTDGEK